MRTRLREDVHHLSSGRQCAVPMARSSCVSGFADIDASLRYGAHHDTSSTVTPLTLEAAPALISLYQPPLLSTQAYPPDTFYSSSSHLLPSVDSRSRLGPK